MLARGDQAVGQRTQPDHAQGLAQRIERGVFGMGAFADAPHAQRHRQRAQRQVDEEYALPAEVRHQHAAQHRAGDQRGGVAGCPDADGLGRSRGSGKACVSSDSAPGINSAPATPCTARPASSMGRPPASPHMAEPATNNTRRPARNACAHSGPQRPRRQDEGRQAQRVGVHHPLQPGHVGAQRRLHRGQGDVDDADVQGGDEAAEIDGDEQGVAAGSVHGGKRAAGCGSPILFSD